MIEIQFHIDINSLIIIIILPRFKYFCREIIKQFFSINLNKIHKKNRLILVHPYPIRIKKRNITSQSKA